ncbi:MAG: glycosyltransferase family 4 protein [Candidatus Micrarchaeaceae archaeon]
MKVLIVDLGSKFNKFGGQARIAAVLNKRLSRHFKTYYLGYPTAYSKGIKNPVFLVRHKGGLSIRRNGISEMWLVRLAYSLFIVRGLRDIDKKSIFNKIQEIAPDVIIANSIQDINLLEFLKKKGLNFKSVYIDHGSVSTSIHDSFSKEGIPLAFGTDIDALTLSDKKKKFFGFYDMNVALNSRQLENISRFTEKAVLIPNGLDTNPVRHKKKEDHFRKEHGIRQGDFVVLYIGRMFDRQKNVGALIRAFRAVAGSNIKLLLVGDGPSLKEYKEMAKGDGRIIFIGSADDDRINTAYCVSSMFVLPSIWEGFSLTILEAASHMLPIAISEGAYVDDLKDRELGKMPSFDPHNEHHMTNIIRDLYKDPEMRRKAVAVSMNIKKRFTERHMVEKYRGMLASMAGRLD